MSSCNTANPKLSCRLVKEHNDSVHTADDIGQVSPRRPATVSSTWLKVLLIVDKERLLVRIAVFVAHLVQRRREHFGAAEKHTHLFTEGKKTRHATST